MIITRKHLSRRTFLRSAGGLVGFRCSTRWCRRRVGTRSAAEATHAAVLRLRPQRRGHVELDTSHTGEGLRIHLDPRTAGAVPRSHTRPLPLDGPQRQRSGGRRRGPRCASASFLTGVHPRETGSDIHAGVSADQVAAEAIGRQTRLASLELGLEDRRIVGLCDGNYGCAYTSCIAGARRRRRCPRFPTRSTSSSGCLAPSMRSSIPRPPRGKPVTGKASGRSGRGNPDSEIEPRARGSRKLDEYLTSIREVERGIQLAQRDGAARRPSAGPPSGIPADPTEHARLMFEFMALRSRPTRRASSR